MKFGIASTNTGPFVDPQRAMELAQVAEAVGFESLWTVEHVVVPAGYETPYPYARSGRMPGSEHAPTPDPLVWLAFLAGVTSTINLATGILILPQRNPIILAKELASLDQLSGGRMRLGIGVGWLKEEFDALGVPFSDRGRRTDEYVQVMRELWSSGATPFAGEFIDFEACHSEPSPLDGTIPVHVGGSTEAAARRAGRLGDGFFPATGDHAELARLRDIVHASAAAAGRDGSTIELTTGGNGAFGPGALAEVDRLRAIGVDRVILPAFLFAKDTVATLEAFGAEVIAKSG